ncbi:hypothetical protein GCM10010329_51070 [Streptomyces spiroverticillatus]|uniref:Uncharacterized protein n=1 Tax=Streptomyces finlayi TaxID=67296 RepID=A0A918X1U3_9ACTN|nr:hypothetical protein [Streptomyces finlayi]GHA21557.1 hypothetical protein GCM10010329_51070 [Streptomyces spiroverticillatus]GHD03887.1 hypothetical protein GCM10010334_52020 [Streptomyces finlayi]
MSPNSAEADRVCFSVSPRWLITRAGVSPEPVQDARRSRIDMVLPAHPARHGMPAEPEEVVPLLQGQTQAAGQSGEHLLGGVEASLLPETAAVVD